MCNCPHVTVYMPVTSLSLICSNKQEVDPIIDPSPIMLDFIFRKTRRHKSAGQYLLKKGADVTRHELSPRASKFTYFTQFYANIRALKPSIGTSPERETRGERERVSENMALAPDP